MNKYTMNIDLRSHLRELIEDTVEYFCDEYVISGEVSWMVIESIAKAKLQQLQEESQ